MRVSLLVLFASVVSALKLSWQIEVGDTNCVAVAEMDEVTVLVGCAGGVHAVDVVQEKVVQKIALAAVAAIVVDRANHYVYLLQGSNLTVVRTTDITKITASLHLGSIGAGIVKSADFDSRGYLFAATSSGVLVVNVKVPRSPVVVYLDPFSKYELTSGAYQADKQTFVAGMVGGVVLYRMVHPTSPSVTLKMDFEGGDAQVGIVGSSFAMCMVGTQKPFWVYDITDPSSPVFSENIYIRSCRRMATNGKDKACTAALTDADVLLLSGDNVSIPKSFTGNMGSISATLSADGDTLYTGLTTNGLGIYDVSL